MKVLRLVPMLLCAVACGGGDDGARGAGGQPGGAGAAGSASVLPGAGTNSGGNPSGASGSSTGGSVAAGGTTSASGGGATVGGSSAGGTTVTGGGGSGGTTTTGPVTHPALRTVVYLPSYRGALSGWATKVPYSQLNYVNLCFADVAANGDVTYADTSLDSFVAAAHASGAKVCMAIGGGSIIETGGVFATVLQDATRDGFVNKLAGFATDHQLDCIDIDLEGNGVNQYYEAFVSALATKLHAANKELTCAVSSWFGDKITAQAIGSFDFMNIMAYDLHNPGGSASPVQSSSVEEATKEVDYWIGRGLQKSKAVFGVPFYGYKWTGATGVAVTYAEILAQAPDAATQDMVTLGGATTYLNSRTTIEAKAKLAKQYGGIMAWEMGQDAAGDASLLKAINDASK